MQGGLECYLLYTCSVMLVYCSILGMVVKYLAFQEFDSLHSLNTKHWHVWCSLLSLIMSYFEYCTALEEHRYGYWLPLPVSLSFLQGLKSFEAYQRYPYEVTRIQQLEPKLAGGCTAAIAVLANNMLYVANVGDSRVVVVKERPNGTLEAKQLTKDDSIENEDELRRLESLGLRREDLLRAGRLGTQENTRSIGDYYIKEGYRDVDSLRYVSNPVSVCVCRFLW